MVPPNANLLALPASSADFFHFSNKLTINVIVAITPVPIAINLNIFDKLPATFAAEINCGRNIAIPPTVEPTIDPIIPPYLYPTAPPPILPAIPSICPLNPKAFLIGSSTTSTACVAGAAGTTAGTAGACPGAKNGISRTPALGGAFGAGVTADLPFNAPVIAVHIPLNNPPRFFYFIPGTFFPPGNSPPDLYPFIFPPRFLFCAATCLAWNIDQSTLSPSSALLIISS